MTKSKTWEEEFSEKFVSKFCICERDDQKYNKCGIQVNGMWIKIQDFIASQIEKTRREAFREGQNSVHVEAQETNGVVKLNVDYAQNAAQSYINKSQDEWTIYSKVLAK